MFLHHFLKKLDTLGLIIKIYLPPPSSIVSIPSLFRTPVTLHSEKRHPLLEMAFLYTKEFFYEKKQINEYCFYNDARFRIGSPVTNSL